MERIYFKTKLEYIPGTDKSVFQADNASAYFENNELHVVGEYHYVYKYSGVVGWYMKNPKDDIDRYLCEGACPTMPVGNITFVDEELYSAVTEDKAEAADETDEADGTGEVID